MKAESYSIILTGVATGNDPGTVSHNLADVFRTSAEKIDHLLSKCPVTVKTDVDHQTALSYRSIIQKAGGECQILQAETNLPGMETGQTDPPVLKICVNCGYAATSTDDPLLTAYDGQGECPACGAIAAKLAANQDSAEEPETMATDIQAVDDDPPVPVAMAGAILSRPWTALLVVLAAIGIVYGFMHDTAPTEKRKDVAVTGKTEPVPQKNPPQEPDIYPGETREVMVTLYLPYLHRDSYSALRIRPMTRVAENSWEDKGVRVEIMDTTIFNETVMLWERRRQSDGHWVPDAGCKISSHMSRSRQIEKGGDLLNSIYPAKVALEPEPSMKITQGNPDQRQNGYTVYRAEILLTISLPSGPRFGAGELVSPPSNGETYPRSKRTGNLLIDVMAELTVDGALLKTPGTNGWKAGKMTNLSPQKTIIDMIHPRGREGVLLRPRDLFPASSTYCRLELR